MSAFDRNADIGATLAQRRGSAKKAASKKIADTEGVSSLRFQKLG
jgi:hypothetical protein